MTLANWRDLAVILLSIEAFLMSLVPAVILFFMVRGMLWVIRKLRALAPTVQGYFRQAADVSEQVSRRVASPLIDAGVVAARVHRLRTAAATSLRIGKQV